MHDHEAREHFSLIVNRRRAPGDQMETVLIASTPTASNRSLRAVLPSLIYIEKND